MYNVVVGIAVALHLLFVGYLIVGGWIALRFPRTIWPHLLTVGWAVVMVTSVVECPLTWLERRARDAAGMAALPAEGFIDHYLTGVLYPDTAMVAAQVTVFAVVISSWAAFWVRRKPIARTATPATRRIRRM
ncbi:DUF2784 domain-containing protein [Gordonia sp. PKS22-38]|uniref:DUF2784 domain-containing protein n=1 Tax=Gordonia prachuapensis TaxID=3115651 RepID=A0ABU7MZR3_9ACTN|nr:DUF2784 domain-containing protein [Gordonia sp. PKS22-38]